MMALTVKDDVLRCQSNDCNVTLRGVLLVYVETVKSHHYQAAMAININRASSYERLFLIKVGFIPCSSPFKGKFYM